MKKTFINSITGPRYAPSSLPARKMSGGRGRRDKQGGPSGIILLRIPRGGQGKQGRKGENKL